MKYLLSIFLVLIFLNIFVWYWVIGGAPDKALNLYFLDVGQGDSELAVLPGGVKVLIDGGPGAETLRSLSEIMPPTSRYIDMVILSHPQLDHFGGLIPILERYKVGVFVWNGEATNDKSWEDLTKLIANYKVAAVSVAKGDIIRYAGSNFEVLAPSAGSISANPNDDSIIVRLSSNGTSALFTGDATAFLEQYVAANNVIRSDILKVSHHGSKTSSTADFLSAVMPRVAVIEVGKNTYGHPAPAALQRLFAVRASVYRTDKDGTVHLKANDGLLTVAALGK
jgi:competence protein ComEC